MNVLVIGANGQIGQIVVDKLQNHDAHEVVAGVRKEEQKQAFENKGINSTFIDLEGSIEDMEKAMENVEAVVFSAGSGGETGADKTMMIDFDGAVKSIEAAKKAGIKRYVIVSAVNADKREYWSYNNEEISIGGYYFAAKHYADVWLQNSGLDYTVIRPTLLLNEAGTGKAEIAKNVEQDGKKLEIPREDVANIIVASLDHDNTIGKSFDATGGDDDIDEAVKKL